MIRFEWDPAKAEANERKHSITFDDAMHVFDDPYALFEQDREDEWGEMRWQAVGIVGRVMVLVVVHTIREDDQDEIVRLISARRATRRSDPVMSKVVRKTLAESPITRARKRKLARMAQKPDSEIDLSDIPPLKESFWKNAIRNPFYRPVKQQLTVRLDADVVAWLRCQGRGYQTRLNNVLRKAMLDDLKRSA
jgi:uncharacterized DUF497 family protein/uncharacterized protein (DUF4415 family)